MDVVDTIPREGADTLSRPRLSSSMSRAGILELIGAVLVLSAAPPRACGIDLGSGISLNGFGTLGVVHSTESQADFVGGFDQPNGTGHTHSWSPGIDSVLGVQLGAHLNDRFSAAVQVVSQHEYDNHYRPELEWANIKYQITPDASLRLGRTVSSVFMASDVGLVRYSYLWVRPPLELYGLAPVSYTDGIDGSYHFHAGEATNSVLVSYGRYSVPLPAGGEAQASNIFSANDTLELGPLTLRAGYFSANITYHYPGLDSLFAGFTQFGTALLGIPGLQGLGADALSITDRYELRNVPYSIETVGVSYDPGRWLLTGEWGRSASAASLPAAVAWYVTGAYRWPRLTPYLTFAQVKNEARVAPQLSSTGLPPALAATAEALNGGINAFFNGFHQTRYDLSAGARWDFMRNADLKLQVNHLRLGAGSYGYLINPQPGFRPGTQLNVVSVSVDFVF